jgi:hypothetical protein
MHSRLRRVLPAATAALLAVGTAACLTSAGATGTASAQTRRELFAELTPTRLANCTLTRYGVPHDGGYLMCANLMGGATSAYSYGIEGRDDWGCDVSAQLHATVHEYDCFDPRQPVCQRGALRFHGECIGETKATIDGRPFDTLSAQIAANGDAGKRLIMKMDVEGAEWASLLSTPDDQLDRIDQLAIEFHHVEDQTFVATVRKLKQHFYVVHFHANNNGCQQGLGPFTSWANEVLFVNKRVGQLDSTGARPVLPNALDSINNTTRGDCQPEF